MRRAHRDAHAARRTPVDVSDQQKGEKLLTIEDDARRASRDEPGAEPCAPLDDSTRFGFESRRVAWPRGWSRNGKTVRGGEVGRIGGLEVNKRARNFSARETFGLGMFVLCETLGIGSCPFDSSDSLRKPK